MSKVAVIMGSISDMPVMQDAIDILNGFDIAVEVDIVSAHRTPEKLFDFSQNAHKRGIQELYLLLVCPQKPGRYALVPHPAAARQGFRRHGHTREPPVHRHGVRHGEPQGLVHLGAR